MPLYYLGVDKMLKYFYRLRRKKGFTLVELIVVVAIIGVLAGVLIPTLVSAVQKANKANDTEMGRALYDKVINTMTEDRNAWISFHQCGQKYQHLTQYIVNNDGYCPDPYSFGNGKSAGEGQYKIVVVAKMDGAKSIDNAAYQLVQGNNEGKPFVQSINFKLGIVDLEGNLTDEAKADKKARHYVFPMKYTSHSDGSSTDRWLVCYRMDNINQLEIWAGDSYASGRCGPRYRIYPEVCDEYK